MSSVMREQREKNNRFKTAVTDVVAEILAANSTHDGDKLEAGVTKLRALMSDSKNRMLASFVEVQGEVKGKLFEILKGIGEISAIGDEPTHDENITIRTERFLAAIAQIGKDIDAAKGDEKGTHIRALNTLLSDENNQALPAYGMISRGAQAVIGRALRQMSGGIGPEGGFTHAG